VTLTLREALQRVGPITDGSNADAIERVGIDRGDFLETYTDLLEVELNRYPALLLVARDAHGGLTDAFITGLLLGRELGLEQYAEALGGGE
jgi:hypothetical protein